MRPYLQSNQSKRARGVAQAVECLSSKHKALSSNPSERKRQRERDGGMRGGRKKENLEEIES
jgi:hypothetical protein